MTDPREQVQEAEQMAAMWLYRGNRASERGDHEKAERHYERSQKWHDKMNRLLGNGDGSDRKVCRTCFHTLTKGEDKGDRLCYRCQAEMDGWVRAGLRVAR